MHQHDEQTAEDPGTRLARHLAVYEHDVSGWHFHFLLPWSEHETDDGDEDGAPSDPVIAGRVLLPDASVKNVFAAYCDWPAEPLAVATLADNPAHDMPPRPTGEAATFTATLLSAAPLCAVTGVALN